jgi:hypothetical protein
MYEGAEVQLHHSWLLAIQPIARCKTNWASPVPFHLELSTNILLAFLISPRASTHLILLHLIIFQSFIFHIQSKLIVIWYPSILSSYATSEYFRGNLLFHKVTSKTKLVFTCYSLVLPVTVVVIRDYSRHYLNMWLCYSISNMSPNNSFSLLRIKN